MKKMPPYKVDMFIAVGLIILSIFVYVDSRTFLMGADIFPTFVSVLIFGLGILLFIDSYRVGKKVKEETGEPSADDKDDVGKPAWFYNYRPYLVFLMTFLYILLFPIIGFFVTTTLFIVALMIMLGVKKISTYVITLLILTVGVYALFVLQLRVPVPTGLLI